jgi:hypothetical protein
VFDCGSSPAEEVPAAFAAAVTSFLADGAKGTNGANGKRG